MKKLFAVAAVVGGLSLYAAPATAAVDICDPSVCCDPWTGNVVSRFFIAAARGARTLPAETERKLQGRTGQKQR